jgi:hypothetical protein
MEKAVVLGTLNLELDTLLNYAISARESGIFKRNVARWFIPCTLAEVRRLLGRLLADYDLEPDDFPLALTAAAMVVREEAGDACLVARKVLNRKRETEEAHAVRARAILIMGGEGAGDVENWNLYAGAGNFDRGTVLIMLASVLTEDLDDAETHACRVRAWRIARGDPMWRAVYYALFGDAPEP